MRFLSFISFGLLIVAVISSLHAQGPQRKSVLEDAKIYEINQAYVKAVKPVFVVKCQSCHGGPTVFPWYYQLPGIKWMIDRDIAEAKQTIDMSKGFPFKGKATPVELLGAVSDVIEDKSMPPWRYRIIHRDSILTLAERDAILQWVQMSQDLLAERGGAKKQQNQISGKLKK